MSWGCLADFESKNDGQRFEGWGIREGSCYITTSRKVDDASVRMLAAMRGRDIQSPASKIDVYRFQLTRNAKSWVFWDHLYPSYIVIDKNDLVMFIHLQSAPGMALLGLRCVPKRVCTY